MSFSFPLYLLFFLSLYLAHFLCIYLSISLTLSLSVSLSLPFSLFLITLISVSHFSSPILAFLTTDIISALSSVFWTFSQCPRLTFFVCYFLDFLFPPAVFPSLQSYVAKLPSTMQSYVNLYNFRSRDEYETLTDSSWSTVIVNPTWFFAASEQKWTKAELDGMATSYGRLRVPLQRGESSFIKT